MNTTDDKADRRAGRDAAQGASEAASEDVRIGTSSDQHSAQHRDAPATRGVSHVLTVADIPAAQPKGKRGDGHLPKLAKIQCMYCNHKAELVLPCACPGCGARLHGPLMAMNLADLVRCSRENGYRVSAAGFAGDDEPGPRGDLVISVTPKAEPHPPADDDGEGPGDEAGTEFGP